MPEHLVQVEEERAVVFGGNIQTPNPTPGADALAAAKIAASKLIATDYTRPHIEQ